MKRIGSSTSQVPKRDDSREAVGDEIEAPSGNPLVPLGVKLQTTKGEKRMTKRIAIQVMTIAMCMGLANVMSTIAQARPQDEKTQSGKKKHDDKMKNDKMAGGKMAGDKMTTSKTTGSNITGDRMTTDKMAGDKMTSNSKMASSKTTGDKMTSSKMAGDKMAGDKATDDKMGNKTSKIDKTDDKGKIDEPKN